MFEYIYSYYEMPGFFRLFSYVSFRALLAAMLSILFCFVFGEYIIKTLRKLNFRENIRSDGPASHKSKEGTPTMGGVLILGSTLLSCLLFGNLGNLHFLLLLICTLLFACVGFVDDYRKILYKNKKGIHVKLKLFLTLFLAGLFCVLYYTFSAVPAPAGERGKLQLN